MDKKRIRFTEAKVRDLIGPGKYADELEQGLFLNVGHTGIKAWEFYRWSAAKGYPVRKALGKWPTVTVEKARQEAKRLSLRLLDRESLQRPEKVTLQYVLDRYEARNQARGDKYPTWLTDLARLSFSDWLERDLGQITKADVADRHDKIATERGRVAAARAVKALRSLYRYADELDLYEGRSPAKAVRVADSRPRTRYYTKDEAARFDAALDDPSHAEWVAPYFRLIRETGARRSNVASMRWEHLDLENGTWRIPAADAKNKLDAVVHLTDKAVAILKARPRTSEWVFPSPKSASGHLVEPIFAFYAVLKIAGLEGLTIHDWRRTKGVRLVEAGAPITVVASILTHKNPATTARVYAHASTEAIKAWVGRV